MTPTLSRIGTLVAAMCCAGPTSAAVLKYDIGGTIAGSPLDGQTFGGYFTVEEAPGGLLGVQLPLLDLEFQFDGVTYDEGDVAGAALFNLGGVRTLFGTACTGWTGNIACELPAGANAWFFGANNGGAGLSFSLAGVPYSVDASITLREPNPVPEPASLALALGALAALTGATLTRSLRSGVR
jgi:hypothetical protein